MFRRSLQHAPGFAELLSHSPLRPHQMSFRGLPGRTKWVPFDAVALEEAIQREIALSLQFRDKARRTWGIHYGEETHIEFTATSDEPVEAFVNYYREIELALSVP